MSDRAHALVRLAVLYGKQGFDTWMALLEDLIDDDDPGCDRMFEAYYAQRRFQEARP